MLVELIITHLVLGFQKVRGLAELICGSSVLHETCPSVIQLQLWVPLGFLVVLGRFTGSRISVADNLSLLLLLSVPALASRFEHLTLQGL